MTAAMTAFAQALHIEHTDADAGTQDSLLKITHNKKRAGFSARCIFI
jgi:hypothetical protein